MEGRGERGGKGGGEGGRGMMMVHIYGWKRRKMKVGKTKNLFR